MATKIQIRRDTAANWASANPILMEGEMGMVTDDPNQYKIGDGVHSWNDLPLRGYTGTIVQETGNNENAVMSQKATSAKIDLLSGTVLSNIVYHQNINFYAGSDGLFKFCADDNYGSSCWLNINKADGTHIVYFINSSNNEWNVPLENRLVLDLSTPTSNPASLRVLGLNQPQSDTEITLLERGYSSSLYKEINGCAGWTGGLLLPYIFNTHTIKAPAYDVIYNGDIDFIDNSIIIYSSTVDLLLIYSRNGNLVHSQYITEDLTFNLSAHSKLVFDLADKTFKVLGEYDAIENTQLLLLKRGTDSSSSSFFGFTQGLWLPSLIKKKLKETSDLIQKNFSDYIEAYVYNEQYYVKRNIGSYTGEIFQCSKGDTISIYSRLENNGLSYAISFWSKRPMVTEDATPQEEPSGFISGVKANSTTNKKLSLYTATAPEGTAYCVVSSSIDDGACFYGSVFSYIGELNEKVDGLNEKVNSFEDEFESLYERRERSIENCQNINISMADLPVSEDGKDIDEGFAYIDTNNNIKIS